MYLINKNIIFVQGKVNGAIYDFNTSKVYSLNPPGCQILKEYINGQEISNKEYLKNLSNNHLIDYNYKPSKYHIKTNKNIELEMAWLEITQSCNLKCLHCYEGNSHISEKNILKTEDWFNIIDQLVELNVKRVVVIGGEPCCYKNVASIIEYLAHKKINTTLFTNATCISNKLINTIIEKKIQVKVSIYGHNPEIHDKITGIKGSFKKTIDNVNYLIQNGIKVSSALIIMKENEDYLDDIVSFIKNTGMNYSRYDVIREVFGGTQNLHIPKNKEVIKKLYLTKPNFKADKNVFINNHSKNTCWYGKISILENGNIIPCEFERDIIYGNVKDTTIAEIINSPETIKHWFYTFDQIEECKDCEYRFACKDCRAMGLAKCRNISDKNPRCLYNPKKGIWKKI